MTSLPSKSTLQDCSSCRFALHNIRKIRPFLTEHAAHFFSRPLSFPRLDYCNALLADFHQTHQTSTNYSECAERLVFKRAQKNPCYSSFYLLALATVAARIQFKTLMLAYRTTTGSAPTYFHSLLRIYIPPEAPPTSTHYYESTSPPEAPPTSTHYYESTSPPEALLLTPRTITNLHPLQKPRLLPLTSTNLHPSRSPGHTSTH